MQRMLDRITMAVTVYLLLAGFLLIGAGLAGINGSAALVVLLLGVTVGLFALREYVPPLGTVLRYDLRHYVRNSWVATALAATTTAVALGATPGEMQTLGGLLGLVAMLNYFLRPVYYVGYSILTTVVDYTRPENG